MEYFHLFFFSAGCYAAWPKFVVITDVLLRVFETAQIMWEVVGNVYMYLCMCSLGKGSWVFRCINVKAYRTKVHRAFSTFVLSLIHELQDTLSAESRGLPKGFSVVNAALRTGGGNPMNFPINAQQPSNHWAYPAVLQSMLGEPLIMPPWCSYYPGSTMNADPSVPTNISYFWAPYRAGNFWALQQAGTSRNFWISTPLWTG